MNVQVGGFDTKPVHVGSCDGQSGIVTGFSLGTSVCGGHGSTVLKGLCYKLEGRWFDSRWCHGMFHRHSPSDRTMTLGSTQPLTELSTRSISWWQRRPACKVDTLPPSFAVVTKSGNLNFLQPSGPVQACNGTAFTSVCFVGVVPPMLHTHISFTYHRRYLI